jgi:O-antigen/teichoic acid export membrane protein
VNPSSPSFARSLSALVSVHLATLLGGILLPVAITRIAGAEALGVFTSASALALLIVTLSDWGYETELPIAVSRDIPQAQAIIRRALGVKFFLWVLSCCITTLVALAQALPHISSSSFFSFFSSFSFVLWLYSLFPLAAYLAWALARTVTNTYIGVARGAERFSAIARIENLCAFASYTLAIGVFALIARAQPTSSDNNAMYLAVGAAALCLVAGECAKTLLLRRFLRSEGLLAPSRFSSRLWFSPRLWFSSFRSALGGERLSFVAIQLLSVAQSRAGMYALIAFSTETELGYFSAIARFIIALRVLPGAAFQVLLPRFARASAASAGDLPKALAFGAGIGAGISLALAAGAELCLVLVYGADFAHLAPVLRILSPLFLLQTLSNILEPYLLAQGRARFVAFSLGGALALAALVAGFLPVANVSDAAYLSLALEFCVLLVLGVKGALLWKGEKRLS